MSNSETLSPTAIGARYESLDVLRGIAVLGILLMNIRFFAMIQAAYFNPTAYGDLSGINYLVFAFNHLFSDQKFMTIFSMLFGAGIVLMGDRAEARGQSATWLHYRRMFWLLVLGAAHAYGLWFGDILVVYAMSGMIVIAFRRRAPTTQLVLGIGLLAVSSAFYFWAGDTLPHWPEEARRDMLADWRPDEATIAKELAVYRSGWLEQLPHRVSHSAEFHTLVFLVWGFWRAGGLMIIGMALYRWGFFSAALAPATYTRIAAIGLGLGLPIVAFGLYRHEANGWDHAYSFFLGTQFNYWASIGVALGYAALVMKWYQSGALAALRHRFAAIGRMAFSNYIAQTLICTTLFYGHGLGLFGHLERWQQMLVVIGTWILLGLWSPWWLARFRYGPLEWLWRSLTYGARQPMRLTPAESS